MAKKKVVLEEGDMFAQCKAGADTILGDDVDPAVHHWLSSGSHLLDLSINRGYPGGRICELFGPESHGKSVLLYTAIKEAQKLGGFGACVCTEPFSAGLAFDIIGVDPERLIVKHTTIAEKVLEFLEYFLERAIGTEVPIVIGIDSIACLQPAGSQNYEWDETPGLAGMSRLWSRYFTRKSALSIMAQPIFVLFLNQIRSTIKPQAAFGKRAPYVDPVENYNTSGGHGLLHAYFARLQIDRKNVILDAKDKDVVLGANTRVKIVKNKTGPLGRVTEYQFRNQLAGDFLGIDDGRSCLDFLKDRKILTGGGGGWWNLDDYKGQFEDLVTNYYEDEEFFNIVRNKTTLAYLHKHGTIK